MPIRAGNIVLPIDPYVSTIEESVCTMKIASFKAGPTASYGIVTDAGIIDAGRRLKNLSDAEVVAGERRAR